MLENPFADDDVGANGVRDKIPSAVGNQGNKFFFHGVVLVWINKGDTDRGGHWGQGRHRGCQ
jgi:hypothetical protein